MTLEEAVPLRHSVRQYLPTPLTDAQVRSLYSKIADLNSELDLNIQLIVGDEEAFNSPMAHYGSFRGVKNLIAVVGKKSKGVSLDERAGYAIAQIVLYAQTLGLNTCIAGMTFKKTDNFKIRPGESLVAAIALGCGESQGKPHPMKPVSRITSDYENAPGWFKRGIDSVLLAPSALNQFRVKFSLNKDGSVCAQARLGFSAKVDLGIFKFYFELGAGKNNFSWK